MANGMRGFGIAAAMPGEFVEPLAAAAEKSGFSTFWVNDTPGADGIEVLARASRVTSSIRLGVGVIPLDRRSPAAIVASIEGAGIDSARLIVGVGSGGVHRGSLALVRDGITELRGRTASKIAIGALGPKMITLAGEIADAVVLNWLTPEWIPESLEAIDHVNRANTEVVGYVRTSLPGGREVLATEASRYESYPAYARHFERMGVSALGTCVFGESEVIQSGLAEFETQLDETVVRAIVGEQRLDSYLDLLNAAAPA